MDTNTQLAEEFKQTIDNLVTLVNNRATLVVQRHKATESLRNEINQLSYTMGEKSAPFDDQIALIEEEIRAIMPRIKESVRTDVGTVIKYRNNPIKRILDKEAIEAYCVDHNLDIEDFKKDSGSGEPSISFDDGVLLG
jgi:hypothetical protein